MRTKQLLTWPQNILFPVVSCCVFLWPIPLFATSSNLLPATILYQSGICGTITQSQWIADRHQYEAAYQALNQGMISNSKPKPSPIDFSRHGVLLISMGQQQTGGYSVKLASSEVEVANGRAKVQVQWIAKQPDMMAVQMLTNPCLLLEMSRAGYDAIDVIDQSGNVRLSVPIR